ncbi:MAG: PAS domain-containing protein, partial [Burkholderiales bacterium]|nr:PAS domain-containing protein [Burkholderiales bacterium]
MAGWTEVNPGLVYQVYGAAFLLLAVVVLMLPRSDVLPQLNRPSLWLLAAFGLLHGLSQLLQGYLLDQPLASLALLGHVLLLISYLPLLEFGRRLHVSLQGAALGAAWVHGLACGAVAVMAWWAADPLSGLAAGTRYFVGMPASLLTGLALLGIKRRQLANPVNEAALFWLSVLALGFMGYGFLTLFVTAGAAGLPAWLPTGAEFLALVGVPVELVRALCALVIALAFAIMTRQLNVISSDHLRRVLNTLNGFVYRCSNDREWTVLDMTAGVEELCGYPRDEFLRHQQTWGGLIHPGDADRVWTGVQEALTRHSDFVLTYRIHTRDGTLRWVHERGRGIHDAGGELLFLEGHVTDATDLVTANENLLIKEAAIESVPVAMAIVGPDDRLLYVNRAFLELWRLPQREAAVGRPALEFWELPGDAQSMMDTLRSPGGWRGELRARLRDGSLADLQVTTRLVPRSSEEES